MILHRIHLRRHKPALNDKNAYHFLSIYIILNWLLRYLLYLFRAGASVIFEIGTGGMKFHVSQS